jgi:mannose-6-phosphate isomerase-like protein (cupin superfamily)
LIWCGIILPLTGKEIESRPVTGRKFPYFNPVSFKTGRKPLMESDCIPPWGRWEVLLDEPSYKVKRITVNPGHRLSYQKHFKRKEHWFLVQGEAIITLNEREVPLKTGEYIDIDYEVAHRIANQGTEPVIFIEVQQGNYFGEDDIIRLEDDYGRQQT